MSHSQFHCTGRVYLDLHGLIFETSICYWQDQPGSPHRAGSVGEAWVGGSGWAPRPPRVFVSVGGPVPENAAPFGVCSRDERNDGFRRMASAARPLGRAGAAGGPVVGPPGTRARRVRSARPRRRWVRARRVVRGRAPGAAGVDPQAEGAVRPSAGAGPVPAGALRRRVSVAYRSVVARRRPGSRRESAGCGV